jgi:hypothetical protein
MIDRLKARQCEGEWRGLLCDGSPPDCADFVFQWKWLPLGHSCGSCSWSHFDCPLTSVTMLC